MIFKRFFTWLFWYLENLPPWKVLLYPVSLFLLGSLLIFFFRDSWLSWIGMGFAAFFFVSLLYSNRGKNWRITLDTIEKRVKRELGGIPDEFQSVFAALKTQTRKTQNQDKLIKFMNLLGELKYAQQGIRLLEFQISDKQWADEELARIEEEFETRRKELEARTARIPDRIKASNTTLCAIQKSIYDLAKND